MEYEITKINYRKITLGNIDFYIDNYSFRRQTEFRFNDVVAGGYDTYEQGPHPCELVIRGGIKNEGVNPALRLFNYMTNFSKFSFSLDGIYFRNAGVLDFKFEKNTDDKHYTGEIKMLCFNIEEEYT